MVVAVPVIVAVAVVAVPVALPQGLVVSLGLGEVAGAACFLGPQLGWGRRLIPSDDGAGRSRQG